MNNPPQIDELLTIADVARILVCSEGNVYGLISAGKLPVICVGNSKGYRIEPADLQSFIRERKSQKEGVRPPAPRPRLKHIRI